ncbi:MAG: DUF1223 domain-containing protein [Casimicrobiaceae bacterium]
MSRLPTVLLIMMSLVCVPAEAATTCRAVSGTLTRPLIELYTSEGCDSCPPADRWFSSQFDGAGGRFAATALAFHVDYWDRLGWTDRFANAAYTERQYQAMRANGGSFVYTPQVLLQGRDFPRWRNGATAAIEAAAHNPARAAIALDAVLGDHDVVVHADARVEDVALAHDAQLFVAYADSGLVSEVKAGENRGVRLAHDHVVRALRLAGTATSDGHARAAAVTLPKPVEAGRHPMLVAFVQRASTGDVLQTLAMPLDGCASH